MKQTIQNPEQSFLHPPESKKPVAAGRIRALGAAAASAVALIGIAPETAQAAPGAAGSEKTALEAAAKPDKKARLRRLAELPGFERQVTEAQRTALAKSFIKVMRRERGSGDEWTPWCSAEKRNVGEQRYVLTAGHCFKNETGSRGGLVDNPILADPANEYLFGRYEYGVAAYDKSNNPHVVGLVDRLTVSKDADAALLSVTPLPAEQLDPGAPAFDDIGSLPIKPAVKKPQPGEQVALYGAPDSNGNRPFGVTGNYIGRIGIYDDDSRKKSYLIDFVAISPQSAAEDPCAPGGSGGLALTAGGRTLGPLSTLVNGGYPNETRGTLGAEKALYKSWIFYLENYFNIKLAGKTLCGYGVLEPRIIPDLMRAKGRFAPVASSTTGGK